MATAFDVNLTITSSVGYRRSSTSTFSLLGLPVIGGVDGPRPLMTTTYTLNGDIQPDIAFTGTRILSVSTVTDYYVTPGVASTPQTISVTNLGNTSIEFTGTYFYFSGNGVNAEINNFSTSSFVILPLSTFTFDLTYIGVETGEYYNYVTLLTNADVGQYKIVTRQYVANELSFTVSPTSYTTSTDIAGFKTTATYVITPTFNTIPRPDLIIPVVKTLNTTTSGWSLSQNEENSNILYVSFNANEVNNNTGTYVSTLTLVYDIVSYDLVTTVGVNVNVADDYNLGSWISAGSKYDSIVGLSYDIINGDRYLTIGIGAGGDGSPIFGLGGAEYITVDNLNFDRGYLDNPYPYWGKVIRIPIEETSNNVPKIYYSKDYIVKNQGAEYQSYFGENLAPGSMFIVEDDGYRNLTVKVNHLRELPVIQSEEDLQTTVTIRNLTRAFYYHSTVDVEGRYYNLEPISADGLSTRLFVGFNNLGQILSYPVPLPTF